MERRSASHLEVRGGVGTYADVLHPPAHELSASACLVPGRQRSHCSLSSLCERRVRQGDILEGAVEGFFHTCSQHTIIKGEQRRGKF